MKFIDTHCHVHFQAYKDDMDEVVKRSLEEGVGMITVGTQTTTSKNGIALAERYGEVWATIGLHPNHLHRQEFFDDMELSPEDQSNDVIKTRAEAFDPEYYRELVSHPKVVAIGEFGLDYYRVPEHLDQDQVIQDQKESCRQQLAFASEFDKPIVIHCRDAHEAQYELLKAEIDRGGLKKRGVIHSFTGTVEDARRYESIGFKLGLNGILTFSKDLQKTVKDIALDQIVVETDAPYLTPPPNRGKRNEPQYVKHIAKFLAELQGATLDSIAEATTQNARALFGI